ncbi:MAG TPA: hypothetical protein V6D14_32645 [Coleofasciculaceae cyanobacterium]
MRDKHQIIEEPDEVKISRPVLKTSGTGDSLAEFNHPGTEENIPNAQGQLDRWIADRDIGFLSHLDELRISNCAENPPET